MLIFNNKSIRNYDSIFEDREEEDGESAKKQRGNNKQLAVAQS